MANRRPVRDIAQALIASARSAEAVLRVMSDLGAIAEAFETDPTLARNLNERTISLDVRRNALRSALADIVHPFVTNAILLLKQKGSLVAFSAFVSAARDEARRVAEYQEVTVTSASQLTSADKTTLLKQLQTRLGGIINIRERINPSLGGGFVLEAGDWRFDGSLHGKIRRLRAALTPS